MKKKFLAFFIIFLLFHTFTFISNASENKTDGSNERNYYALIIGVEKFVGVSYPDEDHIDE